MTHSKLTKQEEFDNIQCANLEEVMNEPFPDTEKDKHIRNLKFLRYSIKFNSVWYKFGIIRTLDLAIKLITEYYDKDEVHKDE